MLAEQQTEINKCYYDNVTTITTTIVEQKLEPLVNSIVRICTSCGCENKIKGNKCRKCKYVNVCAMDGCIAKTNSTYCVAHWRKYENCTHPGCIRKAKSGVCTYHRPERVEYIREYARKYRARQIKLNRTEI